MQQMPCPLAARVLLLQETIHGLNKLADAVTMQLSKPKLAMRHA